MKVMETYLLYLKPEHEYDEEMYVLALRLEDNQIIIKHENNNIFFCSADRFEVLLADTKEKYSQLKNSGYGKD